MILNPEFVNGYDQDKGAWKNNAKNSIFFIALVVHVHVTLHYILVLVKFWSYNNFSFPEKASGGIRLRWFPCKYL